MKPSATFKSILILSFLLIIISTARSQNVAITDDNGYTAAPSAMLDVKSLTKGMLVPRLTSAQRTAINNPANGLLVFDTSVGSFFFYTGSTWISLSNSGEIWTKSGTTVFTTDNSHKVGVGTNAPIGKLEVKADASIGADDPIFEVLNANGDTVFAVYPEGVRINVDDNATKAVGSKGGFAIGGFSAAKGFTNEFLRVTPDSVRVYIDDEFVAAKSSGSRGGFAVGGFSNAKGSLTNNYLFIQDDSTRVYTGDTLSGFGIGDLSGGAAISYMHLTPLNYFIGHQSGINTIQDILNPGMGMHNTFFGYQAGQDNTTGYQNTFIGYQAGQHHLTGAWNLFIGQHAGYNNTNGLSNIFIGKEAGYNNPSGTNNLVIGNAAGYSVNTTMFWNNVLIGNSSGYNLTSGYNNTYLGVGSGGQADFAESNTYIGSGAGGFNPESFNTYVGADCGAYAELGERNVFMGYQAGTRSFGDRNVFIRHKADYNAITYYNNSIAIGDSVMCTASNQARIGNNNTTSFYCMGIYSATTASAANVWVSPTGQVRRSTSSKRYKKDIEPLEINSSKIYDLNPVSYTSLTDNKRHFGLIAEEVAATIPQLAEFAAEKDVIPGSSSEKLIPDAVQYPLISVLLINEMKKHEEMIRYQETQINNLVNDNKILQEKLSDVDKIKKENTLLKAEIDNIKSILNTTAKK